METIMRRGYRVNASWVVNEVMKLSSDIEHRYYSNKRRQHALFTLPP